MYLLIGYDKPNFFTCFNIFSILKKLPLSFFHCTFDDILPLYNTPQQQ